MLTLALFLALAPVSTEDLVKLGEGLAGRGDAKKAQGHLEKALAAPDITNEQKARAEKALGLALLQQKKSKDAVAHLAKSVELVSTDEKAWQLLGVAHDQDGAYAEA